MTIRNLDSLFDPASVVAIGASSRPGSVGATVWRNLRNGSFSGARYALNPKYHELDGEPVYASVDALPQVPELAVVCTPAATVPGLIAQLGARGTRAAIVISGGLNAAQKQAMLDAARPYLLRVLGPNCIGALAPHIGLNGSFAHLDARPGELAFVSQSGALVTAMLDWARARDIGFSHFISLGEQADVDFGDLLDFLASDPKTRAILLYIESVQASRKFMSAARAAARNKPVIVVKAGRSSAGGRAAASHTGALAGSDIVFDAAIRRAGMLRVDTLQDLFLAAETLAHFRGNLADTLTVLTNGGGAGVMAADAAASLDVPLSELSADTLRRLDAELPAGWSHGNPVDIIGDAPVERYQAALRVLADDMPGGAVLFVHAPTAIVPSLEIARAMLPLARHQPPWLMGCWLGDTAVVQARTLFREGGIADYATPEVAVRAFSMLRSYRQNQAQLLETPAVAGPSRVVDPEAARAIVAQALAAGRDWLSEPEAKALLAAYAIAVVETRRCDPQPEAAAEAAQAIGLPVALKILSPDITHKSDVGGVALHLENEDAVRSAAASMLERVRAAKPDAHIDGFSVQAMVERSQAQELIVGASIDAVFGPVILFGEGGTAVELLADRAIGLPPLNSPLARALIERTRVARRLAGYRGRPPADREAIERVLINISQLLADVPQIAELDINPLIADDAGVIALDARVRLDARAPAGVPHFAIRPYPQQLVESVRWEGRELLLRPIRAEDEAQHLEFLASLAPEDVRLRVFNSRRHIEHSELARLTQIDYGRESAFVAVECVDGVERTLGVARALSDPDNIEAEFGIIVRSGLKGGGLGLLLMNKLIRTLREQGTQFLIGTVLAENRRMLDLAQELGFEQLPAERGDDTREIRLALQADAKPA
ncbi:acetate--CoA ligase family protein [Algiphilus sp. W345]|uniref:Acetate--CoA ligase family protein n=1 Tax=Banduia mediterranea TaxID=3075609 RepID=A0ABU2WI02_9GAMM|nr:acetate--CoA ligase family protein [Algiphilus sp. W345]MDT0497513.1 acetate--CoA ligase family protein [Algiphilus sp. W345]